MKWSTKKLTAMGMLIALSWSGANIKLPTPISSIALDAFPAYFAGFFMGGTAGGTIGFIGHLLTAMTGGMPLGFPTHVLIAIMMFAAVWATGALYRKAGSIPAIIVGVVINGVAAPLALVILPGIDLAFAMAIIPALVLGSALNVMLGWLVYRALKNVPGLADLT